MNINPLTMENYVLKNNAQKYCSVRTPTDRKIDFHSSSILILKKHPHHIPLLLNVPPQFF
jgi:hypothetical protein